jgi:hypothetical protein
MSNITDLFQLNTILSTDSISTTRLTINTNFAELSAGLTALIDTLNVNASPDIIVNSVSAQTIVANEFAVPLPLGSTYSFTVNTNGEVTAKSILSNVVVQTPRLRLEPDPTLIAFQAGEVRWSGTDFVGWNGTQWISFTAGANIAVTTGPLVLNQLYEIVYYGAGDVFTNVGASSNAEGVIFVATGTTPSVWTNGSILQSSNGEANTTSTPDLTGYALTLPKAGVNLPFKSVTAGTGIFIDALTDPYSLIINSIGSTSGYSGVSGYSGQAGATGTSGYSGIQGINGTSGYSGTSGLPGLSGFSGQTVSGYSGSSGVSTSGFSGSPGQSGFSGQSGLGVSGFSGTSGATGDVGATGSAGAIGPAGFSGASGLSGYSGEPGPPVLGPPEPGDSYLNGFWTDLTPLTPVGTFASRVNDILLALLPPPAPHLSSWSQTTLSLSVAGKLGFDSTHTLAGYNNADSAVPPVSVDGLFVVSGNRLGISQAVGGSKLSGVLNYLVPAGPGVPDPAYPAQSFGDAEKGNLYLYINGVQMASSIDLTSTTSAIDTTSGGTLSGMNVSAQGTVVFPNGTPLDTFLYRTGTWTVVKSDLSLGYNIIVITHQLNPLDIQVLAGYEVVLDGNTTATSFNSETMYNPVQGSPKNISGIQYYQAGTVQYNININNAYMNTYSPAANAVSFTGNSNTYGTLLSAPYQALAACNGNVGQTVSVVGKTGTVTSSGIRIINGPLTLTTTVLRTVQGTQTSGGSSIAGFLIDNVAATSTATSEPFTDENYRLNTNANYDLVSDVTTVGNIWDSSQSLLDGSAGHTTGMQVIGGSMVYPGAYPSYPSDFRTTNISQASPFNNGGVGGSGRNYTGLTGTRYYIRKFQQIAPTTANFILTVNGSGGTFVPIGTALTGNDIHVEMKLPATTGWMDCYADFITAEWADGDGARNAANGVGQAFNTPWGLTTGTLNTSTSGGYVIIRVSTASTFAGIFNSMTMQFV